MSYIGRKIRNKRFLFNSVDTGLIVPIDHGFTMGAISGLEDMDAIGKWINNVNISAIVVHKGTLELLIAKNILKHNPGIIIQLNGMTSLSSEADTKRIVTSVESAITLGADAVSIQLNFNKKNYSHNIDMLGSVIDKSHEFGLPVLTMLYDKGEINATSNDSIERLARMAVELGTDALKIGIPNDIVKHKKYITSLCSMTNVFFAGGELINEDNVINNVIKVLQNGASGVCFGRNIFQQPNPEVIINKIASIIRNGNHIGPVYDKEIFSVS